MSEPAGKPGDAPEDHTLGGYIQVHKRPPAFEGCDGHPYTVSLETERTADLRSPVGGYLSFPRWAQSGVGVVGHVDSPLLWKGQTVGAVETQAGRTPLVRVQEILNEAILTALSEDPGDA